MSLLIRKAVEEDVATVYNFICLLEEKKFDYFQFTRIYLENVGDERIFYLLADAENTGLAGFISCHLQLLLHHNGYVAEIQELYVSETSRGRGIGMALIKEVEKSIRLFDCTTLEVTAQNKRTRTHNFYQQAGFNASHQKFTKQL